MNLTFKLNVAPIGLNNVDRSTATGTRYKTPKYQAWAKEAAIEIHRNREAMRFFSKNFSNHKDFIVAEYVFGIDKLFCKTGKKKGRLNLKSGDVDNFIKPIQDLIFEAMLSANEDIDDSYVIALTARKIESERPFISASFTIVDGI